MDIEYDDLRPEISADERRVGGRRAIQLLAGVLLVVAGAVMLAIPGPGVATILVGLNLIKPDNRLVRWLRRKVPGVPDDGQVPARYLAVGAALLVIGTAIGVLVGPTMADWAAVRTGLG